MDGDVGRRVRRPKRFVKVRKPGNLLEAPGGVGRAEGEPMRKMGAAVQSPTDVIPDLVFRFRGDGSCYDLVLPKWLESSATAGQLMRNKVNEVLPAPVAHEARDLLKQALRTGECHTFEYQLPGDEEAREYEAVLIPMGEDEGVGLVQDISNRRRLEEWVLYAQRADAVGHLAASATHDFNNLLTAIMGYCQFAMRAPGDGESLATSLREIQKAADRGADLCRQMLMFSRRETVDRRVLNLNDLVLAMATLVRHITGDVIELVTRLRPDLGLVKADSGQLQQVLVNLALNARDAMPDGGRLTIETNNVTVGKESAGRSAEAPPGEYVRLAVSDTGTRTPVDVGSQLLESVSGTRESGTGAGLGLFVSSTLVSQNHGYLTVQSEPGTGAVFEVYLPRVDNAYAFATAGGEFAHPPSGRETVLLVEDEQLVREVAATVLRQEGYTVLEAAEGIEALRLAGAHTEQGVDLLLTDVVMPLMSGWELSDRLRESQPGIRVLYTSGYTADAATHLGSREGGAVFIEKPFTPLQLAQKVRAVLET